MVVLPLNSRSIYCHIDPSQSGPPPLYRLEELSASVDHREILFIYLDTIRKSIRERRSIRRVAGKWGLQTYLHLMEGILGIHN